MLSAKIMVQAIAALGESEGREQTKVLSASAENIFQL